MKIPFCIVMLLISFSVASQDKIKQQLPTKKPKIGITQHPKKFKEPFICDRFAYFSAEFPGGEAALYQYIKQNLLYPDRADKNNIQGTVRVQFLVKKDGSVSNVVVKRPLGYGLDEEAIRVIRSMPKWKPATERGQRVAESFMITIIFSLKE